MHWRQSSKRCWTAGWAPKDTTAGKGPRILKIAAWNCKTDATCGYWASKPPATKPPPRSTTAGRACSRTSSTARWPCTPTTAAWCRSWPRATMSASCCPCWKVVGRKRRPRGRSTASPTPRARGWSARCWSVRRWPAAWPMPGACPASASITWRVTCWRRCSRPTRPAFPFMALLVSGGHTLLAQVEGIGRYQLLGESLDDAAGEAFDKTAKLLGLRLPRRAASRPAERGARPLPFPAPDDRPARPRLQLLWPQDRRRRRPAQPRPRTRRADTRRRRPRFRGSGGRHAGHQVPARARARPAHRPGGGRRRGRQPSPARAHARDGRAGRCRVVYPAPSSAPTTRR